MKTVNIQAAKTHLSRLVEEAAGGTEIVLAKAGKPMVRLVPYSVPPKARTPGLLAGQGWEAANCWTDGEDLLAGSVESPLFHGAVEEPPASPLPGAASP
ncbi:MAG TPA: type II toxin-antitoxin system prevent-host-death family antitoxin [Opitutaceae bacterium]